MNKMKDAEYNIKWDADTMPPEHDSIFKKFFGTSKWIDAMFLTTSNEVLVTIESKGQRFTSTAHTKDGKWSCTYIDNHLDCEAVAWADFPELYSGR